jgi:hypothetical protein
MRLVLSLAAFCLPLVAVPTFAADCGNAIRMVLHQAMTAGPYSIVTTSKTGDEVQETVAQMIPPNAMHTRSETGGQVTEMIVLDGKGWMNFDGTWSELPEAMAQGMAEVLTAEAAPDMIDPQCNGDVIVDGRSSTSYSFGTKAGEATSTTTIYMDTNSWLPWRMLSSGKVGDVTVKTVTNYTYGGDFEIKAPM